MKKYISLLLSLVFVFSLTSIPVQASNNSQKYNFTTEQLKGVFAACSDVFSSEELVNYNSEHFIKPLMARASTDYHIALISNGKMLTTNSSNTMSTASYANENIYQIWQFNEVDDGVFVIRAKYDTTKCLTADPNNSIGSGKYKVNLSTYVYGDTNQYWSMQFSSSGNALVSESDNTTINGMKLNTQGTSLYLSNSTYTQMGFFDLSWWVPTTSISMNDFSIPLFGSQYFYPNFSGPNGEDTDDHGKNWNTYTVVDGTSDVISLNGNFVESNGAGIKKIAIRNKVTGATGYCLITAGSLSKKNNVTAVVQEKSLWCWAACSEMLGKTLYPSSDRDQRAIVKNYYGKLLNSYPNVTGNYEDVINASAWVTYGNYSFDVDDPWFEGQVAAHLDQGNGPLVAMIGNTTTFSDGHMVIISGYVATVSGLNVYVIDPYDGSETLMNYSGIAACTDGDTEDVLVGLIFAT